jgi:glycerate 2-kinase
VEPLELLSQAYKNAVDAAHPSKHLAKYLPDLPKGRLVLVGAGKAAAGMAQAVEVHYQNTLDRLEGLVITRYGHALPTQKIEVIEASHPVPDVAGQQATQKLLERLQGLTPDDLVLCLISGGGSALLVSPRGVTLEQKADLTKVLLKSGADITEMNTVRKHLSGVKGGQLARAASPAKVMSLIVSDVVGDDLTSIASGPTVPDPSTFAEALGVLDLYQIKALEARAHLQKGIEGKISETPKPGDPLFQKVANTLVASSQQSLEAIAGFFKTQNITPYILSDSITGEAREVAKVHAALARQIVRYGQPFQKPVFQKPCVLISGGETTVTVRGQGRGGRNGEFALSLALELDGLENVYALAADSDGIDGSEDNAGAFVTPECLQTVGKVKAKRLLESNDSYSFFEEANTLLVTGPTNTNVNDLRIILIV